jgi:hypothetical protein
MLTHHDTVSSITIPAQLSRHEQRPASHPAHARSSPSNATRTHPNTNFAEKSHTYATGALKAGVSPKVLSERIGHADVGFFLQTYAHVLKNDDRDAAEQAASFLIGDGWETAPDDE